jgi:hypothetical protein
MDILTCKNVLVAEDDDFIRRVLTAVLTRMGGRVTEAANGMKAVALLKNPIPMDLVLLDVLMPEAHGLYVLQQIRAGLTHQDFQVPVMLLTGTQDEASVHYAAKLSCDGFLLKPVNAKVLEERLKKLFLKRLALPYTPLQYRRVDVGPPDRPPSLPAARWTNLAVSDLRVGMVFNQPVIGKGKTLAPAGTPVTEALLTLLRDLEKVALIELMSVEPPVPVEEGVD